ncbi:hypothetical protein T05_3452 [Trichinella murrelli]|uniref:Uncharacterized protein n=1 Tax=Trichinella murrelli TaxID=144512 RepID=A0A0V0TVJ8_9BILA|nr:hypothetical protein T05_3452 [Trichinella murrelli]
MKKCLSTPHVQFNPLVFPPVFYWWTAFHVKLYNIHESFPQSRKQAAVHLLLVSINITVEWNSFINEMCIIFQTCTISAVTMQSGLNCYLSNTMTRLQASDQICGIY